MKRFGDLNLRPPTGSPRQTETMVRRASELGYRFLGVSLPPHLRRDEVRPLQDLCEGTGIDLVTRLDLRPRTPRELLGDLGHLRRRFEVVAVACASKSVARQAAKDHRVDLLSFPPDPRGRFFDSAEAELASSSSAALELETAPLLRLRGVPRIQLLRSLRREVEIAGRFGVALVASSGAIDEYQMRAPQDYAALATLFDLPLPLGLRALSDNPWSIVERNREKLSPDFVAPGIRVVRKR